MNDYSIAWLEAGGKNLALYGQVLKLIAQPVDRVKQIDLWMELGLLSAEEAALLVEGGYVFNRSSEQ